MTRKQQFTNKTGSQNQQRGEYSTPTPWRRPQEEEGVRLLRRYAPLNPVRLDVQYYPGGVRDFCVVVVDDKGDGTVTLPIGLAETRLAAKKAAAEEASVRSRLRRRLDLPEDTPVATLTAEQNRILRFSQTEWEFFRARTHTSSPSGL